MCKTNDRVAQQMRLQRPWGWAWDRPRWGRGQGGWHLRGCPLLVCPREILRDGCVPRLLRTSDCWGSPVLRCLRGASPGSGRGMAVSGPGSRAAGRDWRPYWKALPSCGDLAPAPEGTLWGLSNTPVPPVLPCLCSSNGPGPLVRWGRNFVRGLACQLSGPLK